MCWVQIIAKVYREKILMSVPSVYQQSEHLTVVVIFSMQNLLKA